MPLFNLTDITVSKNAQERKGATGPLQRLTYGSEYESNTFRYPIDLGNYDKGHYIIIHINQQRKTRFPGPPAGRLPTVVSNTLSLQQKIGSTNLGSNIGTVGQAIGDAYSGTLKKYTEDIGEIPGVTTFAQGFESVASEFSEIVKNISSINFLRTIEATTDTIALYMPDTLNFAYIQHYDTPAIGGTLPTAALAAGTSIVDAFKGGSDAKSIMDKLGSNMSPFIAKALAAVSSRAIGGNLANVLFAAGTGTVVNPMIEVLYSSPQLRTFRFDFMLYPRDEKESLEVQKILERLRFHQAPEILPETGGFFLVPPSEFDVKFYYNGQENPNIPKISTCVLTTIDMNYAPNGWSAYEVPGNLQPELGATGMPVAIRLSLQFKETEILTKDSFDSNLIF